MDIQKTVILMPIVGVLLFASYGFGANLATPSEVDQLESLRILPITSKTVVGMDMGTGDTINSIVFTFHAELSKNTTVTVSIKDSSGVEIGSGSFTTNNKTDIVTVVLSDTVNASERPGMASISITT